MIPVAYDVRYFLSKIIITSSIYETRKPNSLELIFVWIKNLWNYHIIVQINTIR